MSDNQVTIERAPYLGNEDRGWLVRCRHCSVAGGGGLGAFVSLFGEGSVIVAAQKNAWPQALWWARWHVAEHVRTGCQCCGRPREVPPVTILDGSTVKVGDRLFTRNTGGPGWTEHTQEEA